MQRLASCATRVKRWSSIAFDCSPGHAALGILRYPSQTGEFDCLRLLPRSCSAWHPALPESNGGVRLPSIAPQAMQRLASCATRVKRESSITFDCTQGHEALGILRYPSQTGEFDCLRLLPRPCSAWHPALPESNGRVRLPSIAPKAMKRLASCATRGKRISSIAFDCTPGHAVLGILCVKRVSSIAFDCSPGHAVLGILRYPSQTGEFDCTPGHAVLCWGGGGGGGGTMCRCFDCTQGHEVLGILRYPIQTALKHRYLGGSGGMPPPPPPPRNFFFFFFFNL